MDESYISEKECRELLKLEKKFIKSYAKYRDSMSIGDWLQLELKNNLPEKSHEEISNISKEIINTIDTNDNNKDSLKKAINNGRSKESWFASSIKESLSYMSIKEFGESLSKLDEVIQSNNKAMIDTITTKAGNINKNPNLDGFIAEQYHVNSFNRNAALKGSEFRAEALVPKSGQTYGKNSVDIVVRGSSNKIHRYQVKYGKTAEDTINMIKKGNYNNQRLLVPKDQVDAVKEAFPGKTVVSEIEFNKIKSQDLTKQEVKELQEKIQSTNKPIIEDWNSFNTKQLATKIGKDIGTSALYSAAISTGFHIVQKVMDGEKIESEEVVEVALESGKDTGIKVAIAGAIKTGVEKGIIKVIPKGTPVHTIANIVYIGIENAKIAKKVFGGDITLKEAMDEMEINTTSIIAGTLAASKGFAIGASIGSVLGPVGTAIGGFIGGTIGYMAGSKVGESVTKGVQKIREVAKDTVANIASSVKDSASIVFNSVSSRIRSLLSF
ncbi:MAG: hypothetical protein J6D47_06980 [Peptostreptococcaceae bacterium]|nr:hypothetical protein [Peptostreptococcaceae bacterium]